MTAEEDIIAARYALAQGDGPIERSADTMCVADCGCAGAQPHRTCPFIPDCSRCRDVNVDEYAWASPVDEYLMECG